MELGSETSHRSYDILPFNGMLRVRNISEPLESETEGQRNVMSRPRGASSMH